MAGGVAGGENKIAHPHANEAAEGSLIEGLDLGQENKWQARAAVGEGWFGAAVGGNKGAFGIDKYQRAGPARKFKGAKQGQDLFDSGGADAAAGIALALIAGGENSATVAAYHSQARLFAGGPDAQHFL